MLQIVFAFVDTWPILAALFVLMAFDVLSGLMVAVGLRTVSSAVSWRGMMRKSATWLVIGTAGVIEQLAPGIPLARLVAVGFIVTEALSILENAARLGVIPHPALVDVLSKINHPAAPPVVIQSLEARVELRAPDDSVAGGRRRHDPPPYSGPRPPGLSG